MTSLTEALLDLKRLDRLASGSSPLHRLDPRAKLLATVLFILCVVSFDRYQLSALMPFFILPACLIGLGQLPLGYLASKLLLVCPFVLAVGALNPLLDRAVLLQVGGIAFSGGWISLASILVRTVLTVGAALILASLTGFPAICRSLQRLGLPGVFAMQLLFLYRYLFVLAEEVGRAARARELRAPAGPRTGFAGYASLLGHLLLRTWQRAERMHMAMLARGFSGTLPEVGETRFAAADWLFLSIWSSACLLLRFNNGAQLAGRLLTGWTP